MTIACGGTTVQPGDIIVGRRRRHPGDPAGAWPRRSPTTSLEQEREDTFIAEMVAAGQHVDGLFPMNADWQATLRRMGRGEPK